MRGVVRLNKMFKAKAAKMCLLFLFFTLIFGALSGTAMAQEEPGIEEMYVLIWPEYLNNDVVVNQIAVFANDTEKVFQGRLEFLLPKEANPLGLSIMLEDFHSRYYEVVAEDDYQIIRYDMLEPLPPGGKLPLMVEYSYPLPVKDGLRDKTIQLIFNYPVGTLGVGVQKPLRVSDFRLNPDTQTKTTDREGFEVYQYEYTNVGPGKTLEFAFSYTKEDNLPSLDPEPTVAHEVGETKEGLNSSTVIIIVIAFLLIIALALLLSRTMGQNAANPGKKDTGKGKNKTKKK